MLPAEHITRLLCVSSPIVVVCLLYAPSSETFQYSIEGESKFQHCTIQDISSQSLDLRSSSSLQQFDRLWIQQIFCTKTRVLNLSTNIHPCLIHPEDDLLHQKRPMKQRQVLNDYSPPKLGLLNIIDCLD